MGEELITQHDDQVLGQQLCQPRCVKAVADATARELSAEASGESLNMPTLARCAVHHLAS